MSCISGSQSHHLFRNNYAMMKIFDQEFALELYLNEIRVEAEAEGMAKAIAEGELMKAKEIASTMKEKGFQDNIIAEILNISIDTVHQWLTEPSVPPQ